MEERLLSSEAPYRRLMNGRFVERLLSQFLNEENGSARVLWSVLLLDLWLDNYNISLP